MNRGEETRTEPWRSAVFRDQSSCTCSPLPVWMQMLGQDLLRESMIDVLDVLTAQRRPLRVIDLGCGVGDWTAHYARLAPEVMGVDLNPSFVTEAHRRGYASARVRFQQADMREHVDFAPRDMVCFGATLLYLNDAAIQTLLERIAAAQTPGDLVYARVNSVHGDRAPFSTPGAHYRAVAEYLSAFCRHGYRLRFMESSLTVVALRAALRAAGRLSAEAIDRARLPIGLPVRLARCLYHATDHYNYVFERFDPSPAV